MTSSDQPELIVEVIERMPWVERVKRIAAMTPEERAVWDRNVEEERVKLAERDERERLESERRRRAMLVQTLATDLGPRYSPERATLDGFQIHDGKRQTPVVNRLREISAKLDMFADDGGGLVFIGSVGTGKDHLAAALLYVAAGRFGLSCSWVNGRAVFQASRDAMTNEVSEAELLRPFLKPAILCISDPVPVSGALTAWNTDLLYRVIDERYRYMRPTWMTLNVRDAAEADARLSPPVFDRLRDQAEIVSCFWASYRKERRAS